jgi:plasmid stability protein
MTTVKIELPDEQAAALKARAAEVGLTLEDWIRRLAREASANQPRPRNSRYSLSELMAQCDTNAPLTPEDRAWMDAPAIGREAL